MGFRVLGFRGFYGFRGSGFRDFWVIAVVWALGWLGIFFFGGGGGGEFHGRGLVLGLGLMMLPFLSRHWGIGALGLGSMIGLAV